jgi:hypothetical protein
MAGLAAGLYLLSGLGPSTTPVQIAIPLGVAGLGTGIFISPNNSSLMGSAPKARQGIAAGILATSRNFGMVLGVGLAGAVFTTILAKTNEVPTAALFDAIQTSFLIACGIALLGLIFSAKR